MDRCNISFYSGDLKKLWLRLEKIVLNILDHAGHWIHMQLSSLANSSKPFCLYRAPFYLSMELKKHQHILVSHPYVHKDLKFGLCCGYLQNQIILRAALLYALKFRLTKRSILEVACRIVEILWPCCFLLDCPLECHVFSLWMTMEWIIRSDTSFLKFWRREMVLVSDFLGFTAL